MSPATRRALGAFVLSALRDLEAHLEARLDADAATRAAGRNPHSLVGETFAATPKETR